MNNMVGHTQRVFASKGTSFDATRQHSPLVSLVHCNLQVLAMTNMNFYRCARQRLRLGMIMEDMDGITTIVGFKHIQDPKIPLDSPNSHEGHHKVVVVTAGYRRIDVPIEAEFQTDRNIVLTGFVSWTGSTSMEITIDAQQKDDATGGLKDPILVGKFICVPVAPDYRAGPCVPLKVETREDQQLFAMGEKERLRQEHCKKTDLSRVPPTEEELALLRSLQMPSIDPISLRLTNTNQAPSKQVAMSEVQLRTTNICMPTEVSAQMKLFGGFQLRTAYELAYQLASEFNSGKALRFLCTTNGSFLRPVDLGSEIYRVAQVCYTEGKYIQIYVTSSIRNKTTGSFETVNKFNFTFEAQEEVPTVVPFTCDESLRFLHARRELCYALNPVEP